MGLDPNADWFPTPDSRIAHLEATVERLQRRCEIYAAGITAIATYEGEYGLGYETPARIAQQTLSRVEDPRAY